MRFAIQDDFLEISNLFKKNQKLFPHIRMGYLLRSIQQNECIYTDGVVIIFKIHQRTVRIGNKTKSLKSDCHLNKIVSTTRDGSASKILNQFFITLVYFLRNKQSYVINEVILNRNRKPSETPTHNSLNPSSFFSCDWK